MAFVRWLEREEHRVRAEQALGAQVALAVPRVQVVLIAVLAAQHFVV